MKTLTTLAMIFILAVILGCGGGPTIGTPPPVVHSVSLTWTEDVTGVITYSVYRSTTPTGPWTKIATTTQRAYLDNNIAEGTYYYAVDAEIGGQSYRSNILKATP